MCCAALGAGLFMTQRPTPPPLGIDDAYLYGAWIEDVRFDGWDLLVAVRYDDRVSGFFELEPRLNLLACTIFFQTVRNRAEAEAFRQQWEASDQGWSLSAVSTDPAGGYWLATREGSEITVNCEGCQLEEVELVSGEAVAWPLPHAAALFPEAQRYIGGEPITLFDDPEPVERQRDASARSGTSGYLLLAAGLLGLLFVVTTMLDISRAGNLPAVVFWTGASLVSLIGGVWLLRRGPPQL